MLVELGIWCLPAWNSLGGFALCWTSLTFEPTEPTATPRD